MDKKMQYKSKHQINRLTRYFKFSSFIALVACSLVLLPLTSHANAGNRDLVYKLWQINSNDKLLDNIKKTLLEGEDSLVAGLEKSESEKISQIVDDNFVDIKQHMLDYMVKNGRASVLDRAHKWLVTPLGQKISKMELSTQSLFNDPEAGIPKNPPDMSKERASLMTKFERITFAPANAFLTKTMEHFIYLQNYTRPPDKRLTDKELEQGAKLISVKMGAITSKTLPHVFDKAYGSLSLEEVTVYLNFLDSEGGRGYNDLFLDAYIDALKETRPKALLQLSKLFEDELSVLSPYSKVKIDKKQEKELMALLIKRHGIHNVILAMLDARGGQMTIIYKGDEKEVFGRPNHKYVTLDTLMSDLDRSGKDIRRFYQILQKKMRSSY
jgi:hypothetical protein